jgi:hypothetical protein
MNSKLNKIPAISAVLKIVFIGVYFL